MAEKLIFLFKLFIFYSNFDLTIHSKYKHIKCLRLFATHFKGLCRQKKIYINKKCYQILNECSFFSRYIEKLKWAEKEFLSEVFIMCSNWSLAVIHNVERGLNCVTQVSLSISITFSLYHQENSCYLSLPKLPPGITFNLCSVENRFLTWVFWLFGFVGYFFHFSYRVQENVIGNGKCRKISFCFVTQI